MADLQDFINDITADKKRYCLLCFRTENERKLVDPVALAEFVKLLRLQKLSKKESACIYCERQAEVALKLYKTLVYARHVNQVLWSLVNKKMSPKGIAYLLPSKVRGQNAGPGSVKRNKLLSLLRRYQAFVQTDVLVVDATTPNIPADKNSDADVSIVIEDDDPRPTTAPRLVPIEKLLEKRQTPVLNTIESMSNLNPGSLVLYPVKTSSNAENQFLVIPEGANVQIDGNGLNVVNEGPTIPVLLPNGHIVSMQPQDCNQIVLPTDNMMKNQGLVNVNQINTVEEIILSDNRKIGEKIIMLPNGKQFSNLPNNINKIQYIQNSVQIAKNGNVVQFLPNNNVQINQNSNAIWSLQKAIQRIGNDQMCHNTNVGSGPICKISDLRSEAVSKGGDMCQISDLRSLQEGAAIDNPPEPKKKSDPNIDWEDKIPMDVISFMDANDPNAANIIAQHPASPKPPKPAMPPLPPMPPMPPAPREPPRSPSPPTLSTMDRTMDLLMPTKRYRRSGRKRNGVDDDFIVIN